MSRVQACTPTSFAKMELPSPISSPDSNLLAKIISKVFEYIGQLFQAIFDFVASPFYLTPDRVSPKKIPHQKRQKDYLPLHEYIWGHRDAFGDIGGTLIDCTDILPLSCMVGIGGCCVLLANEILEMKARSSWVLEDSFARTLKSIPTPPVPTWFPTPPPTPPPSSIIKVYRQIANTLASHTRTVEFLTNTVTAATILGFSAFAAYKIYQYAMKRPPRANLRRISQIAAAPENPLVAAAIATHLISDERVEQMRKSIRENKSDLLIKDERGKTFETYLFGKDIKDYLEDSRKIPPEELLHEIPENWENEPTFPKFVCPILFNMIRDPVLDPTDGTTLYERNSIVIHLQNSSSSPKTRKPLQIKDLIEVPHIKAFIDCKLYDHVKKFSGVSFVKNPGFLQKPEQTVDR